MFQMTSPSKSSNVSSTKHLQKGTENLLCEQTKFDHSQNINGRSKNKDSALPKPIRSASKRKLNTSSEEETNSVRIFFK